MSKLAIVFISFGFIFIVIGGCQFVSTAKEQKFALSQAKVILEESKSYQKEIKLNDYETITDAFIPKIGETVGILQIPKLSAELPIIEGTNEDELARGVGHYLGSAYPTQKDQIVLSGHRDTVFRKMGELVIGDKLTIKLPYGEFSYEIVNTEVVPEDDLTVIGTTFPNETLTLTTCYPFNFLGNAPDRYIITAHPITKN